MQMTSEIFIALFNAIKKVCEEKLNRRWILSQTFKTKKMLDFVKSERKNEVYPSTSTFCERESLMEMDGNVYGWKNEHGVFIATNKNEIN